MINYLDKKEINEDCLKEDQREFVEKNKLIYSKYSKVKGLMFLLKKLTRLV